MKKFKKYPLLICMIISAVIIVASLFVIGFTGLKFDTTITGGSQIEVVLPEDANSQEFANNARVICKHTGLSLYHTTIETKFVAGSENGEYTTRVMILTFGDSEISAEKQLEYREELAEKLGFENLDNISEFKEVKSMIETKNIWFIVLAIGIIVACAFIFAWIRYDIFAGIAFIIAYLHNIILFFALSGITRLPIGLASLAIMIVLTFIMSGVLVHIMEEYRKIDRLHIDNKLSTAENLISAESKAIKPYAVIAVVVAVIVILMMLSPSFMVRLSALSMALALIAAAYTVMLVAPGIYAYLIDLSKASNAARLSRNDTKNKAIKKKIAKSAKAKKANS